MKIWETLMKTLSEARSKGSKKGKKRLLMLEINSNKSENRVLDLHTRVPSEIKMSLNLCWNNLDSLLSKIQHSKCQLQEDLHPVYQVIIIILILKYRWYITAYLIRHQKKILRLECFPDSAFLSGVFWKHLATDFSLALIQLISASSNFEAFAWKLQRFFES